MDDCQPFDPTIHCRWCGAGWQIRLGYPNELERPWGIYHRQCWRERVVVVGEGPPRPLPPASADLAGLARAWNELRRTP